MMDETKYFLVLTDAELTLLERVLDSLVDKALEQQDKPRTVLLVGMQLQCRSRRAAKHSEPEKGWRAAVKEQLVGSKAAR